MGVNEVVQLLILEVLSGVDVSELDYLEEDKELKDGLEGDDVVGPGQPVIRCTV